MRENCNEILSVKDIAYRDDNAGLTKKWRFEDREGKEQGRREFGEFWDSWNLEGLKVF